MTGRTGGPVERSDHGLCKKERNVGLLGRRGWAWGRTGVASSSGGFYLLTDHRRALRDGESRPAPNCLWVCRLSGDKNNHVGTLKGLVPWAPYLVAGGHGVLPQPRQGREAKRRPALVLPHAWLLFCPSSFCSPRHAWSFARDTSASGNSAALLVKLDSEDDDDPGAISCLVSG